MALKQELKTVISQAYEKAIETFCETVDAAVLKEGLSPKDAIALVRQETGRDMADSYEQWLIDSEVNIT